MLMLPFLCAQRPVAQKQRLISHEGGGEDARFHPGAFQGACWAVGDGWPLCASVSRVRHDVEQLSQPAPPVPLPAPATCALCQPLNTSDIQESAFQAQKSKLHSPQSLQEGRGCRGP